MPVELQLLSTKASPCSSMDGGHWVSQWVVDLSGHLGLSTVLGGINSH